MTTNPRSPQAPCIVVIYSAEMTAPVVFVRTWGADPTVALQRLRLTVEDSSDDVKRGIVASLVAHMTARRNSAAARSLIEAAYARDRPPPKVARWVDWVGSTRVPYGTYIGMALSEMADYHPDWLRRAASDRKWFQYWPAFRHDLERFADELRAKGEL